MLSLLGDARPSAEECLMLMESWKSEASLATSKQNDVQEERSLKPHAPQTEGFGARLIRPLPGSLLKQRDKIKRTR